MRSALPRFGSFVAEDDLHSQQGLLALEVMAAGRHEMIVAYGALATAAAAALPDVFGTSDRDPEWMTADPRTDREIAEAAIYGLPRVFVPASMLAGA